MAAHSTFSFLYAWNSFVWPLIVIAMIAPVTVFLLAQRYFVENVASSGLKG